MVCVPCLSGGDSPSAQICTKQFLQGAQPGSCWVYILHFQSNTPAAFSQCAEAVSVTAAWSSAGVQVTGAAQTPKPAGIQ